MSHGIKRLEFTEPGEKPLDIPGYCLVDHTDERRNRPVEKNTFAIVGIRFLRALYGLKFLDDSSLSEDERREAILAAWNGMDYRHDDPIDFGRKAFARAFSAIEIQGGLPAGVTRQNILDAFLDAGIIRAREFRPKPDLPTSPSA